MPRDYDRTAIPTPGTTYQAARVKCTDCMGGERIRIKDCPIKDCTLWPHRHGIGPVAARKKGLAVGDHTRRLTMKDLRRECLWCMGGGTGSHKDIRECKDTFCGLHAFRMGKRVSDL